MTEKDNIEQLFEQLKGKLDTQEPAIGHRERFMAKLETLPKKQPRIKKDSTWWKPLAIAASLLLLFSLALNFYNRPTTMEQQLSKISPEAVNSQYYFTSLIEEQVKTLQNERGPETDKMINDVMTQLNTLENDYKKLEQDLINGGNTKLILSAMIGNFQTRIGLLNEVIKQLEEIKSLKTQQHENSII